MFPATIETDSLTLVRLAPDEIDVHDLYDLFAAGTEAAAAVFEYIPQEPFETPKDAFDWLTDAAEEWDAGEGARYGVRADDALVGTAALSTHWEHRLGSLGVILDRPHWGEGYATECAEALTELALEDLDLELITIGYDEGNERSKAVIERFVDRYGGQYDGVRRNGTVRGDEVVDAYDYSVTQAQYRAAGAPE